MAADGSAQSVTGVYPQGVLPVYTFTLDDGRSVTSSLDHLWRARFNDSPDVIAATEHIRDYHALGSAVYLPATSNDGWRWLRVVSVEPSGEEDCVCISVSGGDGLFVLDNGCITHNTDALIGAWLMHMNYGGEHTRGVFFRRTYPELSEVWTRMLELYPATGAEANKSDYTFTWPHSPKIELRYLESEDDAARYMGRNWSFFALDEICNWADPAPLDKLWATLRSAKGVPCIRRLAGNPGGPGTCLPFGEVFTPDGWVNIKDMQVGDPVYTVAADGSLQKTVVGQVHSEWYEGNLHSVSARGLRMVCTPNHRVAKVGGVKKDRNKAFSLVPISELPGQATILRTIKWHGKEPGPFSPPRLFIKKSRAGQPQTLPPEQFFELLGWWLSEGSAKGDRATFTISQIKPRYVAKIREMLDRCGFKYRWSGKEFIVCDKHWASFFESLGKQPVRFIPQEFKDATPKYLDILLRSMVDGDGTWETQDSGVYFSSSPQLADDFCEIALKLGYIVYHKIVPEKEYWHDHHVVSFKRVKSGGTELLTGNHIYDVDTEMKRKSDIVMEPFKGWVYCIGIEGTETFLVRQAGSVWVSGNSWVKERYIDDRQAYVPFKWAPNKRLPHLTIESIFIPALLDDNKILLDNDPGYESRLAAIGDDELYRAWRYGDWNILSGRYFSAFKPERSVVSQTALSAYFPRWIAVDHGFAHDTAVTWGCYDGTTVYIYREFAASELTPPELARIIVQMTGQERIECVYLSPDASNRRNSPRTIEHEYREALPWPVRRADNDRIGGWSLMQSMFKSGTLKVFSDCKKLIKWLSLAQRDPKRPEDVLKASGDDLGDSLRYLIKTSEITPRIPDEVIYDQRLKPYLDKQNYFGAMVERFKIEDELHKGKQPVQLRGKRRR